MRKISFGLVLFCISALIHAQGFDCYTHSMTQAVLDANPNRKAIVEAAELMHRSLNNNSFN